MKIIRVESCQKCPYRMRIEGELYCAYPTRGNLLAVLAKEIRTDCPLEDE